MFTALRNRLWCYSPSKESWAGDTPAIHGRERGLAPVEGCGIDAGWTVDKTDEAFVSFLDEASCDRILDQHAERIEEPEHVDEDDGWLWYGEARRGGIKRISVR